MSYLRYLCLFGSSLLPVVCRRVHVLFTLCLVRLYFQLFVGGFMSYLRYVWFVFTSSCLQEGSCLIYVMFGSSLLPVVCRRVHVLFTLCLVRLYFQLFVGGFMSYLRYVWFVFTSSYLQEGSCLIYVMFGSSLLPVVCRRVHVLFTLCLVRLYFQLFVGGFMSYLHYVWFVFTSSCLQEGSCLINDVWFVFTSSCLQEGSCLIYVKFGSSLLPVVCRRVHVLFTLCLVRLYFQLFVGGFMSYLRYVWFVFTSSCLQEGSCLIYVMFGSSLLPVVCRRVHVLFTLCLVRLYFQLFVGGFMSYLRYVWFVFTSSCLQEGSCLIYVMFGSSLLPVVCRRVHVLFTLCLVRLYFQLFVGGFMSYLRYVWFVFTSSCLQEGSCLIYIMFGSSLLPVVCRRVHVLLMTFGSSLLPVCRRVHVLFTLCLVRLYFQLFVGGFMSYLRYVWFVFTSSCLQEGSCLIYVMFGSSLLPVVCRRVHVLFTLCLVRLYFQLFVGGFMSYLRYVWFVFTSSCLQEGSCLIYIMFGSSLLPVVCRRVHVLLMMFGSSLLPVVCRRVHVLFTLCLVRLYFQLFVGGFMSYLRYVWFVFTSSCLQEGSCLIYVMFGSSLLPVVCRRVHVLFTLCLVCLYFQLFVGGFMSYLRYVWFVFTSSCLQEGSCLIYVMFGSSLLPVVCRRVHVLFTLYVCLVRLYFQLFVGGFMSYLRYVWFVFTSSCLQEGSCLINDVWFVFTSSCLQEGSCLINDVWFVFTSSCLQEGSCLIYVIYVCLVRLYFQLFVGGFMSY